MEAQAGNDPSAATRHPMIQNLRQSYRASLHATCNRAVVSMMDLDLTAWPAR